MITKRVEARERAASATMKEAGLLAAKRKHLHGRGEDVGISIVLAASMETLPRAWGRPAEISTP